MMNIIVALLLMLWGVLKLKMYVYMEGFFLWLVFFVFLVNKAGLIN